MVDSMLTYAQEELLNWIKSYVKEFQHSPSIRQMMVAMNLKSPAPIQSRLKHLQDKGFITWQEGRARTIKLVEDVLNGIPIMGTVAAGGLVDSFNDIIDTLDISSFIKRKGIFALKVNGDSMIDACIADGDTVLMQPMNNISSLRQGDIVCALVPGLGTTLKYYFSKGNQVILEPANPSYEPIQVSSDRVDIQGKLVAVWRQK